MTDPNDPATAPRERVLTIILAFDAPRALVFRAWTDPATVVRWMGSHGFTATSTVMTFHQAVFDTEANRDGHRGGWTESFERLEAELREPALGGAR